MAFLALLQSSNPIGDALNNTEWAFPLAECFHIVFFGIAIGTIMLVNLRLMGLAFPRRSAAELAQDTWVWTLVGLVVAVIAGMALFVSDPRMYSFNEGFRFKITVFVLAVIYHYTVHAKVVSSGTSGVFSVLVGLISVLLWVSVVAGGIFIAFI
jgi:hypothetical protein